MKNKLSYTFAEDLSNRLKDPEFKQEWTASEPEYLLACQLIEKRLEKKISQRELAKKVHTSQAVISRIESMQANPSLDLLKRIAHALNLQIKIQLN